MVNPDAATGGEETPRVNKSVARHNVCQRARKDIEAWLSTQGMKNPFPKREQDEHVIPLDPALAKLLKEVEIYGQSVISNAGIGKGAILARWLACHLQRRALSSPHALRESLQNRIDGIDERLKKPEGDDMPEPDTNAMQSSIFDRDPGEKTTEEEAVRRTDRTFLVAQHLLGKEKKALEELLKSAKKVRSANDSKLQYLCTKVLPELLKPDSRCIIFTRYVDTLKYLEENMPPLLDDAATVLTMHGDMSEAQRREVFSKLERAKNCVLIATDVISEGINLQHACGQVIHYELPWNPNRLEQRNGRVDRFGQPRPTVRIKTLVMDNWLDHAVLETLIKKARRIREERGFSPPFWGDEESMLDLLRNRGRSLDGIDEAGQMFLGDIPAEPDTEGDPLSDETLDRIEEDCFYGEVDISLPDVQSRLERSRKLIGSAEQIERFVRQALANYHCTIKEERDKSLTLLLPEPRLQLQRIGNELKKATFNPEMALADPDLTVLDIGHPLVRRLIELVREDFFRDGADSGRIAAFVVPKCKEVTVHYRYLARFTAGSQVSVLEEIVDCAFPVYKTDKALSQDELDALAAGEPGARQPSQAEVKPHYDAAWDNKLRESVRKKAIEERRRQLIHEREELQQKIAGEKGTEGGLFDGIEKVALASVDLLTVTVYLPR